MQRKSLSIGMVALAAVCGFARANEARTSFLHFGKLDSAVVGRVSQCDFEFTLWDAPEGGERLGKALLYDGWEANKARVPVERGYFEVVLDFGVEIHDDEPVYVESRCACGRNAKWRTVSRVAVSEDLLVEDNRIEVTAYSTKREIPLQPRPPVRLDDGDSAGTFNNTLEAADGDPSPAVEVDAEGNTSMVGDLTVGGAIRIDGDNNPLEIYVNGSRALRFEYHDANSQAPNVIGGSPSNEVGLQKAGAVISGGGSPTDANLVSEDWGTVAGGRGNHAFGMFAAVSGGSGNTAAGEGSTVSGGQSGEALGARSTVGGGIANDAEGDGSTVAGGAANSAVGAYSSIGGGLLNSAGGDYASVPGGFSNSAAGDYSVAMGRRAKADHAGSFVWGDSTDADFTSTAPDQFLIRAAGNVGIGTNNPANKLSVSGDADFSGNVGVGTDHPTFRLHVKTNASTDGIKIEHTGAGFPQIRWTDENDELRAAIGVQSHVSPAESKLLFHVTGADRMAIDKDGNVGIGTTTPANKLSVSGDADFSGNVGIGTTTPANKLSVSGDADFSGNVGIGTTNPKRRLHNTGDYYGRGHVILHAYQGDGEDGTAYIQARDDSHTSSIDMQLRSQNAGNLVDTMTLTAEGDVGIGTTSPSARLDVNGGSVRISDYKGVFDTGAWRTFDTMGTPEAATYTVIVRRNNNDIVAYDIYAICTADSRISWQIKDGMRSGNGTAHAVFRAVTNNLQVYAQGWTGLAYLSVSKIRTYP